MFQTITGFIDVPGAATMIVLFICIALAVTTWMATYKTDQQQQREFQIEKMKLDNSDRANERANEKELKVAMADRALKKEIEFKRIDSGMIDLKTVKETDHG